MSDYNTIIKLEMLIDKNIKFCKFDLDGKIWWWKWMNGFRTLFI